MAKQDEHKNQIDKFREAARDLETDNGEARFDATLERIAKAPPPKDEKSTKATKPAK
ncbi:DNA-binding protein [Aurantimonas sp. A3-2-R12]|uniref:DNA-binding protein n=1 Tax=Aurantimonas sp. A3-2-R12 TaxID=3114362 RepID=UPI002E18798E|nr:DNA-binding protein [Aurantimonas sp. A3-2-R12]